MPFPPVPINVFQDILGTVETGFPSPDYNGQKLHIDAHLIAYLWIESIKKKPPIPGYALQSILNEANSNFPSPGYFLQSNFIKAQIEAYKVTNQN